MEGRSARQSVCAGAGGGIGRDVEGGLWRRVGALWLVRGGTDGVLRDIIVSGGAYRGGRLEGDGQKVSLFLRDELDRDCNQLDRSQLALWRK